MYHEQTIRRIESSCDLIPRSPWLEELGISVPMINNACHTSDCLGFRADDMGDDGGDAVGPRTWAPVETDIVEALDLVPNLIMNLSEEDEDRGSQVRFIAGVRRDWHGPL
jgi:hypothetical protein